jgi:hypothetical protein
MWQSKKIQKNRFLANLLWYYSSLHKHHCLHNVWRERGSSNFGQVRHTAAANNFTRESTWMLFAIGKTSPMGPLSLQRMSHENISYISILFW